MMGGEGDSTMVVFVDNNLGCHLALIVSLSDAFSDLKKKIEVELPLYYPYIGEVKIESLKVRLAGKLYAVLDSMHVNAFCEANGRCFVSIEARERVDGSSFLGPGACENGVRRVKLIEYRAVRESDWNGEANIRNGFSNKGSAIGCLEAGSNKKSERKSKRGKKKRKRADDVSTLDHGTTAKSTLVAESWVANVVAGALCDVKGGAKSVVGGPSITAEVLLEGVDTQGEVVTCEKNESRNKLSIVNFSDREEFDQHGKDDRIQSSQSSRVKEDWMHMDKKIASEMDLEAKHVSHKLERNSEKLLEGQDQSRRPRSMPPKRCWWRRKPSL